MKNPFYFLLVSLFVLISCSNDNDATESKSLLLKNDYPQTWKLIKMTGSYKGSETVGEEMEWKENYVFMSDGTFVKTRIAEGESQSASGTYDYDETNQNFLLEYEKMSNLVGTCDSEAKEYLYFDKDGKILLSNWWACDGPGLFYERIK